MIEVLKQALEALYPISHNSTDDYRGQADKAITSLRQAIAELESQEPVAVVDGDAHNIKVRLLIGGINLEPDTKLYTHPPQRTEQEPVAWMDADGNISDNNDLNCFPIPLYTTPPQRKPLTDEEIETISAKIERSDFFDCVIPFARAIESAHGIGEKE